VDELNSAALASAVAAWRERNPDGHALQEIVRIWTATATGLGIPVERQLWMLRSQGVGIGGGAAGTNPDGEGCPYCMATKGGSHGGLCPNGTSGMAGENGQPFSGGGGGGTAYLGGIGLRQMLDQGATWLSDYVWTVLRWMAERPGIDGKFTASMVANGGLFDAGRDFIFTCLKDAEEHGYVARWRPDIGSPWYWQLTPNGVAALAERPVQP
jgi:hypothetical protein